MILQKFAAHVGGLFYNATDIPIVSAPNGFDSQRVHQRGAFFPEKTFFFNAQNAGNENMQYIRHSEIIQILTM